MWNHKPHCDCPVCYSLPRIFQLIGTGTGLPDYPAYVSVLGSHLRHLEGELRDEVARRFPGVGLFNETRVAPPAQGPTGETKEVSQANPPSKGPSQPLQLATKVPPPVPPPQLTAPGSSGDKPDRRGSGDSHKSPKAAEKKEVTTSSPRRRSRSRERRRSPRTEDKRRGVHRTPSPRAAPERKRSKDRDRKRRRSTSSREKKSEGGKERKRHPEKPPEPAFPPSHRGGADYWGPRAPNYPPPARQGRGWVGELPVSTHPRWTSSENKGQVKRAKQDLYNRRHRR